MPLILPGEAYDEEAPEGKPHLVAPPCRLKVLLYCSSFFYLLKDLITAGLEATFERRGDTYSTVIRKVYPEVREGKFKADFKFTGDQPENIRAGQTYYLNLQLGQPEEAVLIPRGSFYQKTAGKYIFVLDKSGKRAARREIRIGRQNPQFYEVIEGLQPGEQVIISDYDSFGDNDVLIL